MNLRAGWYRTLNADATSSIRFVASEASAGRCHSVAELIALHAHSPLLTGAAEDHDRGGEDGSEPILVLMAPDHLPLQPARALAASLGQGRVRAVRSAEHDGVIAAIGSAASLRRISADGSTTSRNGAADAIEQAPIGDDLILDTGRKDDSGLFDPDDAWHLPDATIRSFAFVRLSGRPLAAARAALPFEFILGLNAPIGALARSLQDGGVGRPVRGVPSRLSRSDIDVIAVTTDRYRCVAELLGSIRTVLGSDPTVTVVVQAPSSLRWRRLARRHDATLVHVEADSGLAWSRNLAVDLTSRPLVLLMDDDFQLDERCRIDDALAILDHRPDITVLGGNLLDVDTWSDGRDREVSQGFAMRLIGGPPDVVWLRLEDAPRRREFVSLADYIEVADIVDNFALFRRSEVFDRGVRWNPALKIGAEHQDLYIRLRALGDARSGVARTNALKVRNVRVQSPGFRRLRGRTDQFFAIFFRDLGLSSFRIVGERLRVRSEDGGHVWQQGLGGDLRYMGPGVRS